MPFPTERSQRACAPAGIFRNTTILTLWGNSLGQCAPDGREN